jgi:response regulator RpfG family c-di-GMP phosphodiesterase
MAVRLPDAITSRPDELTEGEWEALAKIVNAALTVLKNSEKRKVNLHEELKEIFRILINIW